MEIIIRNCNSINEGIVRIKEGVLNIRFGINGTGKSTIAKAIYLQATNPNELYSLTPFKYINEKDGKYKPLITGSETIKKVSIFDEGYINQFVFKKDEVIENSFEIFIKNEDYQEKIDSIEAIMSDIRYAFSNNEELNTVIDELNNLSNCFGNAKSGVAASSSMAKGFSKGNKIQNIPKGLEVYSTYLQSKSNASWIKWQLEGAIFLNLSDNCPYCVAPAKEKLATIKKVSEEYDANSIGHLVKVLNVIDKIDQYFSDQTKQNLKKITEDKIGLSDEGKLYLKQLKEQIDTLSKRLLSIKSVTFFSFTDIDNVKDRLDSLLIDIKLLPLLESLATKKIIDQVNKALEGVIHQAGLLQGEVAKQKAGIKRTIDNHKTEINDFLKFAGYKYIVDIADEKSNYKMMLRHIDSKSNLSGGNQHLSYGEKNAFSLILFMYATISKNPDLIILDDPISSFDRNKKFAIIEMLFKRKNSFKDKTVLLMTHDLEPIIDIVSTLSSSFRPQPNACFIKSRLGIVSEIEIKKEDILTFTQVCKENLSRDTHIINKLIYLRRYYEITDDKGMEYQLLSNLFHKRDNPEYRDINVKRIMTNSELDSACSVVRGFIEDFDYNHILSILNNNELMLDLYTNTDIDYEKLQLFRIINDEDKMKGISNVIRKYINETYHIENDYIMQLNPFKYEVLPEFVVQECDRFLLGK
ncbi:hypothetical protein YKD1_08760 [Yersinia pseudotuberculosis]|uniref:hypothetical protein n=1 Tax=Yersinia pseudotuberculosis TaxID=633 RepID=UPI0038B618EC